MGYSVLLLYQNAAGNIEMLKTRWVPHILKLSQSLINYASKRNIHLYVDDGEYTGPEQTLVFYATDYIDQQMADATYVYDKGDDALCLRDNFQTKLFPYLPEKIEQISDIKVVLLYMYNEIKKQGKTS